MTLRPEPQPSLASVQIVLRVIANDGAQSDVVVHYASAGICEVEDSHFLARCESSAYGGGYPPSTRTLNEHLGRILLGIARRMMRAQEERDADPKLQTEREKFCGLGFARDHWESRLKHALSQLRHTPEPTDAPTIPVTGIESVTAVDQAGDHEVLSND